MKKIGSVFSWISWIIWLIVVLLNTLGVTEIPWSVAITPMVVLGVTGMFLTIWAFSKARDLEKMFSKKLVEKLSMIPGKHLDEKTTLREVIEEIKIIEWEKK